jgi:hypothetical protein
MLDADSALLDMPAAPILAAAFVFHYRPMLDAYSALYDGIAAPVLAAESPVVSAAFVFLRTILIVMPHA